ncbi:MAG: 50S ribosomal protein L32 [bacterium]|nr:50S ribosomal protein L32 [bacterium]
MGLPGHRRTSGDKRRRLTHIALTEQTMSKCPKCGKAILPHRACAFCGTYKGRTVLNLDKRATRAKRKTSKK